MNQSVYRNLNVQERPKLSSIHNGQELIFLQPAYGPGTYADVKSAIEQDKLKGPTMAETASLAYAAFNPDDVSVRKYIQLTNIMEKRWLWAFTRSRYEPNKGTFVYDENDHDEFKDPSAGQLEQLLGQRQEHGVIYSNDRRLRFVPFGYKVGEISSLDLAKNPYVIALAGEEGAEKLAKVADKHKNDSYLWGLDSVKESTVRVSNLYSDCFLHLWLGVGGNSLATYPDGSSFAILTGTTITSPKN